MKHGINAEQSARARHAYKLARANSAHILWQQGIVVRDTHVREATRRALLRSGVAADVAYLYSRALYSQGQQY